MVENDLEEKRKGERESPCVCILAGPDHSKPSASVFPWSGSTEAAWLEAGITQHKEHDEIMQETAAVTSAFRIYIHKL